MIILLVVIGIALGCGLMGAITGIMIDRWIRETEQLEANPSTVHGRHAKTQPRTTLAPLPLPQEREPGAVKIPGRRYAEYIDQIVAKAARTATTATDIAPVVLPEPGTYKPQAGRDSGPGTVTMARLDLPATTGEMAAVTDQYLADMAVKEEQFRLGLAT